MARILLEKAPPIARIIFNRPEVVNATDGRFVRELHAIGERCASLLRDGPSAVEHGDFLYDERGLPK